MAKRSFSHRTAAAAVKRGHGGGGGKAMGNGKGNTATYPSAAGSKPAASLLSATGPNPTKWGGSKRAQ